MSTAPPTGTPVSPVPPTPAPVPRARAAIVAALLALGALTVAAVALWQPWGGRNRTAYADLAPRRDTVWLGSVLDGMGVVALAVGLALAVCLLAPRRGSRWADVGAVLTLAGGAAFSAGIIGFGTLVWYVTDTRAVTADTGTRVMAYVKDNAAHALGLQAGGFLLLTLGSLVLMVALWRARSVPAWLPAGYAALTVAVFVLGDAGAVLGLVQAAQTLSLLGVAFFAFRAGERGRAHGAS